MRFGWLALAVAGCTPLVPLDEVPIVGGTDAQRALIEAELASFDALAGPGRAVVREIGFGSVAPDRLAEYTWDRRIRLGLDVDDDELQYVLRHELCHALDDTERLSDDAAVLDRIGSVFRLQGRMDQTAVRAVREEAFALLCGDSAPILAAAAAPCVGDPEPLADAAAWVLDVAWEEYAPEVEFRAALGPPDDGVDGEEVELPHWLGEVESVAGWVDGPAAAVFTPRTTDTTRWLGRGPDGLWAPGGCVEDEAEVRLTPGRAWVVLDGGDQVHEVR